MAIKISKKNLDTEVNYEPALPQWFGITDETTNTKAGTLIRVQIPPRTKSSFHYHTNGDLFFFIISGTCIFEVGEKKRKEYVLEAEDFFYSPRGEVHSTYNPSETQPCEALAGYFGCSNPYKSGKVFVK
ncbi:unnamed protein product [marine sediment metagenome]|uniref:Cupin type-2 domain-containing protein n=1 Tax=marine sediment metagenome TaxID=412755 RepID=X0YEE1_9ZZZZ